MGLVKVTSPPPVVFLSIVFENIEDFLQLQNKSTTDGKLNYTNSKLTFPLISDPPPGKDVNGHFLHTRII